jgi:hypothetical protein
MEGSIAAYFIINRIKEGRNNLMFNQKITHYLMLVSVALLSLAAGLTSCVYDDDPIVGDALAEETEPEKSYQVSFLLNVGNASFEATRTINEDTLSLEDGDTIENYIDLTSVNMYFYGVGSNKYGGEDGIIQKLKFKSAARVGGTKSTCYIVRAEMDKENLPKGNFKIVVTANWPVADFAALDSTNLYNLACREGSIYKYDVSSGGTGVMPTEERAIPMYGVRTYTAGNSDYPNFQKGKIVDIGQVDMIRAMAKVELICDNVPLKNVHLTHCMPVGTCAPVLMITNTTQATTTNLFLPGQENTASRNVLTANGYTIVSNKTAKPVDNIYFNKVDDKRYVIYIPEYRNDGGVSGISASQILFDTDYYSGYSLDFVDYSSENREAFNILRNHIYRYRVKVDDTGLVINYIVIPWNKEVAGDITFD